MKISPETEYRKAFAAALVARAADACPADLDARVARRFRVYRNNVYGALIDALGAAYPVVKRLVGENFFSAMAREFSLCETTRETSLALYGGGFADFIEGFTPAAGVAYLADVARLERARLEALHAPDAPVLEARALPGDGSVLLTARFEPHPALRLVGSPHPIVSIWQANQDAEGAADIVAAPECALVTRPAFAVDTSSLDRSAGAFTRALMTGVTLGDAYRRAAVEHGDFDVGATFARLLEAGAFALANLDEED